MGIIVIMGTFNHDNSLGIKYPELASNWDYDENKRLHTLYSKHPLTPFDVAYSSHRKVAMKYDKHGTYMQNSITYCIHAYRMSKMCTIEKW